VVDSKRCTTCLKGNAFALDGRDDGVGFEWWVEFVCNRGNGSKRMAEHAGNFGRLSKPKQSSARDSNLTAPRIFRILTSNNLSTLILKSSNEHDLAI